MTTLITAAKKTSQLAQPGKSHDHRDVIVEKPRFQKVTCPREDENENSSGLKNVFEELHFRDGLVWTEGLAIEKHLRLFSNSFCLVWKV